MMGELNFMDLKILWDPGSQVHPDYPTLLAGNELVPPVPLGWCLDFIFLGQIGKSPGTIEILAATLDHMISMKKVVFLPQISTNI